MEIAGLLVSAEWNGNSAEHGLDRLDAKFVRTEKAAQQFGQKVNQAGNETNQSTGKIDQAGKAVNSTGDKMERAGKQVGNLSDRLRDSRGKFATAGQGASEFTGKIKSVESASDGAGSRIGALISKITGFNRASREMSSGGGMSSFLPGLANISEIIQGIPQIGQLAGALVRPLTSAAEAGVRFNAFMETSKIGFETLLGSSDKALAHLSELSKFADATPFQFEGLVSASQRMQAFGFTSRDVIPTLTAIGDALSATGGISQDALDGVLRQFGQMRSSARVTAEDMQSIADHNVPAWDLLATAIGKTVAQTRKLAETGRLNGREAVSAIAAQMEARYGGQMARVSGTLTGRMSNLQDIQARAQGKATEGLTRDISETIGAALNQGDLAGSLAAKINLAISPVSGLIKTAAVGLLGGGITSGLTEGIAAGKDAVKSAIWDMAQDSILNTAKDALGIHSPSEEFRKLGIFSAQGFAEGLLEGQGIANNATQRMMGSVLAQAKSKLSLDKLVSREPDFLDKLKIGSQKRGINPDHLLNVMAVETSGTFNPAAKNPTSSASGLIQFMASTAKELGTTTAALRSMSATKQLDYVFKYFDHYFKGKDLSTQGALYSAVGTGKVGRDDEAVVMRRGDRGYAGNAPTWDRNGDGIIKQGEMALAAIAKLGAGVNFSANGGVLPVRVVGGDMGAPTASDNAYMRNKMLVRPSQREDYTSGRDPFMMPDWAKAANPIEKIKDDSVAIFGVWDKTNQILRDTGQIVVDVQAPFEELKTSGSMLGAEFLNLKPLITDIGIGVAKVTEQISTSDQAAGAWADRVIQKSNKAWKEMSDGFQSSFMSALSSTEGGVKGMLSRMGLGFAQTVEQMVLKAEAAKIAEKLFGDTSDDKNTGGWLGKLLGKLGVSGGKKGSSVADAVASVTSKKTSTGSTAANASRNQSGSAANVFASASVRHMLDAASDRSSQRITDKIDSTSKSVTSSIDSANANLGAKLDRANESLSIISAPKPKEGFWSGLFHAALNGAISGATNGLISGIGSGGGSSGGSNNEGPITGKKPGQGAPPVLHTPGHALGGFIAGQGTATSDSILSRLSNGEFVIKASSVAALGRNNLDFINQFGKLPAFATGGFIGSDNYVPPVVNNYSTSGKSGGAPAVNHHHYNFNIHAKDAQSFHKSERQIQRQLVSAVRGSGHN